MTPNGFFWIVAGAIALAGITLLRRPRLRRYIPLYSRARFLFFYLAGRHAPFSLGDLYRGCFAYGDQDSARERVAARSRLIEQDRDGFSLWEIPAGRFWIPPRTNPAFLFGVFAEQDRDVYSSSDCGVRSGDVVVDCGANIGAFVWKALASGAKKVIAVEISPATAECLRRNFAEEIARGRVVVYGKGMWHREDSLQLRVHPENSGENTVVLKPSGGAEGPVVPLTTIDRMVRDLQLDRVDFIKLDIEGAEQNALRGAAETIAAFHPRVVAASYHLPDDVQKLSEIVRAAWPACRVACGPCSVNDRKIRAEVLHFS